MRDRLDEIGPVAFARDEAMALAAIIGDRWEDGQTSIASEHLATSVIRSLLFDALSAVPASTTGPRVLFGSTSGERHDLGLIAAAIVARAAGADVLFVGADIPEADLIAAVETAGADILALGFVCSPTDEIERVLQSVRSALPASVEVWIGGQGIRGCAPVRGVDRIETLERIEAFVLEARRGDREVA